MKRFLAFVVLLSAGLTFCTSLYLQTQANALDSERVECLQALMMTEYEPPPEPASSPLAESDDVAEDGTQIGCLGWDRSEP
jgi:hypothetical protein